MGRAGGVTSLSGPGGDVLIIEDEMLLALQIESLLEEMGFGTFDIADSPERALASALAHRPDLITVPVVFVTGNIDDLIDQDPFALVEKPISHRSLARACEHVRARAA